VIGLFANRSSRFVVAPNLRRPFKSWCEEAASTPHSVSRTPSCTGCAVVDTVGRFGTAVMPLCAKADCGTQMTTGKRSATLSFTRAYAQVIRKSCQGWMACLRLGLIPTEARLALSQPPPSALTSRTEESRRWPRSWVARRSFVRSCSWAVITSR